MIENDKKFVFLTNSPERTPHELSMKLERMGLEIGEEHFYTSALATAIITIFALRQIAYLFAFFS